MGPGGPTWALHSPVLREDWQVQDKLSQLRAKPPLTELIVDKPLLKPWHCFCQFVWFDVTVRHYKSIVSGFGHVYRKSEFIILCDCHGQIVFIIAVYNWLETDCWFTQTRPTLAAPIPTSTYIFKVIYFPSRRQTLTLCFPALLKGLTQGSVATLTHRKSWSKLTQNRPGQIGFCFSIRAFLFSHLITAWLFLCFQSQDRKSTRLNSSHWN